MQPSDLNKDAPFIEEFAKASEEHTARAIKIETKKNKHKLRNVIVVEPKNLVFVFIMAVLLNILINFNKYQLNKDNP
jgi:hypothetical protein